MTLEKAIALVETKYAAALANEHIRNPLAYALYQVWKMADADEKTPTDLNGKCGGCFYAKPATNVFGRSKSYVECTNAAHLAKIKGRSSLAHVRQRTCKACKEYKRRDDA